MLDEYFAVKIDEEGLVREIPLLLRDYKPDLDKLPLLLMRLGPQVCMRFAGLHRIFSPGPH
jgi:DNA mismatch repair protein MLH1